MIGSGKITHTHPLLKALGAIRVSSDVERKRLFNPRQATHKASGIGTYLTAAAYEHLASLAHIVIAS